MQAGDILAAQTTADPRRRSVIETYCGSTKGFAEEMKTRGYKVDPTCMYRRLIPSRVCSFFVFIFFSFFFFF